MPVPKLRADGWWLPLLLVVLMTAAIFTWLDKWLYSNEVFNSLSMGLSYEREDEALSRLRAEALRYCDAYAPKSELKACKVYQEVIADRVYFAHPLTALIGLQTRALLNQPDWPARLHRIAVEPPLIGGAIAFAIWFFLTLATPRADRTAAVVLTFLLMTTAQGFDRELIPLPDPIRDAGGWLAPLGILTVSAAAFWIAARAAALGRVRAWIDHYFGSTPVRGFFWLAIALYVLSMALPAGLNVILAPLALLTLLALLLRLVSRTTIVSPLLLAGILGLLFTAITADSYWFMRRLGTSAGFATLIYVALIGLGTLRPKSRLVWTMPILAIFHLPLTALLGLATILAEAVLALRRRQASGLLPAAGVAFAIGMTGIVFGFESAAFAPGSARPFEALQLILTWPGLAPVLVSLALVGVFAIIPLRHLDDTHIALARGGLLIFQGLGAALVSAAIQEQDPSLLNAPGYAMFAKPASYMTPALFGAGIFAILLTLRRLLAETEDSTAAGIHWRGALPFLAAMFLLIAVSKVDLKLRNSYGPAPLNLWRYVIAGEIHPQWCRHLRQARLDDEVYYLSKEDSTNDAVIYWSALKARLRTDAGVFRPEAFTVLPSLDDPKGCAASGTQ